MKTGIKPRVNEAREFLEIAKDFKDPKEILREALSNAWDAGAKKATLKFELVRIPHTGKRKIVVEIKDDGDGMNDEIRTGIGTSEIEDFFNLGDSHKPYGSIGTKGHGTKIYYKSDGISVETWKKNKYLLAEMEIPPWETLQSGKVPTYKIDDTISKEGKGTKIIVDGFKAKQKDFQSTDELVQYILWYTVIGSFGNYFGSPRKMDVELKPTNAPTVITIPFGFKFPDENVNIEAGSDNFCKIFPEKIEEIENEDNTKKIKIEIVGALLGENKRELVPHTYEMMGLWLCKDYIKVERTNKYIEEVFGGQYFYRSMLILANCQDFDLTANRNNIRSEDEEYNIAIDVIKKYIKEIKEDSMTKEYFEKNKKENEDRKQKQKEEEAQKNKKKKKNELEDRINKYKGRSDLNTTINGAPIKEPINEAETSLVLQAMITSGHRGIDFRIGEYNAYLSTDLLVEYTNKGIPTFAWVELVHKLENLYSWLHPVEAIHKIVCWELGNVKEKQQLSDGRFVKLSKKMNGRYNLDIESDTIDVYVLKELLQSN